MVTRERSTGERGPVRDARDARTQSETASGGHSAEDGGLRFKLRAVTTRHRRPCTLISSNESATPCVRGNTCPRLISTTRPLHAVKGVSPCVSCGALRWLIGYGEREKPMLANCSLSVARTRPCEEASPDGGTTPWRRRQRASHATKRAAEPTKHVEEPNSGHPRDEMHS